MTYGMSRTRRKTHELKPEKIPRETNHTYVDLDLHAVASVLYSKTSLADSEPETEPGEAEIVLWNQSRSRNYLFWLRLHGSRAEIILLFLLITSSLYCSQCGGCQEEKKSYVYYP